MRRSSKRLEGLIVAIVLIVALGAGGFVIYQRIFQQSSPNRASTSSNNVILDKRTSLNETNDQYNPYNPYPFESASYDMQLSSGTYRATIHTTGTVYVYVKLNGCYDETLYHCTRLQEAFTSSENPPNVATFTATQSGGYI